MTQFEEEKEKRKKKKLQERVLHQMQNSGVKILKSAKMVFAATTRVFFMAFEDDKFIAAFLESSGIKKKPNYEKQIAENTAAITKSLKEKNCEIEK